MNFLRSTNAFVFFSCLLLSLQSAVIAQTILEETDPYRYITFDFEASVQNTGPTPPPPASCNTTVCTSATQCQNEGCPGHSCRFCRTCREVDAGQGFCFPGTVSASVSVVTSTSTQSTTTVRSSSPARNSTGGFVENSFSGLWQQTSSTSPAEAESSGYSSSGNNSSGGRKLKWTTK